MKSTEAIQTHCQFEFSSAFTREFDCMMKMYDETYDTLSKVLSSSTVDMKDEYGVCNNNYKFRYIKPENIASYVSYLMKALSKQLISYNISDMEKFSVQSVKNFMIENKCVPIENSSIYGLYRYTSDTMTLKDLVILCENDVYHTSVCSKYDMTQRKSSMKKDWEIFTGMHFSTNIKKMVSSIPKLMGSTDYCSLDQFVRDAIRTYVESFILFSIMMNAITLSNMTLYCVPKSTYNMNLIDQPKKVESNSLMYDGDSEDTFQETVDVTENKPIYCVFVQGDEFVSHMIQKFTKCKYSHAIIAFDENLEDAYGYDTWFHKDVETGNRTGFHKEDLKSKTYENLNMTVFSAYVSNDNYKKLKDYVESFKNTKTSKVYDYGIILNSLLGIDKKPTKSEFKQVCSSFVDAILKQIGVDVSGKNIPSPKDLVDGIVSKPTEFVDVYDGNCWDYAASKIKKVLSSFATKKKSHAIGDVVTECCLLKTNNMVFNNKIPFNINMRNIVLEDMHPQFKDTRTAIHFITKDSRSPISQLLIKYASNDPKVHYVDPMLIVNLFGHYRDPFCAQKDAYAKHHEMDFHTDVNWLDKIAYGNNYLNGNYRVDGVGNHHMDPIRNSLDTLYRMYGDCDLVESKELADHIIKVSALMKGIIQAYAEFHIQNWEMVRDILAVLGEIMTRCMIKLYNNHMTIFVASDNMDDVDVPGYLYTESFVMEAESTQPSVQVTDQNGDNKQQTIAQKVKMKLSQLFHKFVAWVQNVLVKAPFKFNENHKRETEWVKNNAKLNDDIITALDDHSFTASTTNFPHYKIPANELIKHPGVLTEVVKNTLADMDKDVSDGNKVASALTLKKQIYPTELAKKIESLRDKPDANQERIWVTNYVLYGNPDHQYVDHNTRPLTSEEFKALRDDLLHCGDLMSKVEEIEKDLSNALDFCEKECKNLEAKQNSNIDNTDGNNNTNENVDKKLTFMNNMQSALKDISNSYHVAVTNLITTKFYPTSYALYRDIVTAYQQQKKSNNLNTIENPKPAEANQSEATAQNVATNTGEVTNNG